MVVRVRSNIVPEKSMPRLCMVGCASSIPPNPAFSQSQRLPSSHRRQHKKYAQAAIDASGGKHTVSRRWPWDRPGSSRNNTVDEFHISSKVHNVNGQAQVPSKRRAREPASRPRTRSMLLYTTLCVLTTSAATLPSGMLRDDRLSRAVPTC